MKQVTPFAGTGANSLIDFTDGENRARFKNRKPKDTLNNSVFITTKAKLMTDYLVTVSEEATMVDLSKESDTTPLNTCKKPMVFGMFPVTKCDPRDKTDVAFGN